MSVKAKRAGVSDAVLAFLRSELERRYLRDNVCRFKELKGIEPEVLAAFRDFTLIRIYPEGGARAEIDGAFASLHGLLHSPHKMASLGSVAVAALWRLGRSLPAAVSAAHEVIHAHFCASAVESRLAESVLEQGMSWKSGLGMEYMRPVYAGLPPGLSNALIASLVHLLELAANRETMETGLELLQMISESMSGESEQWTDMDRGGARLAMDTLREAIALFEMIDDRNVPRFIKGVEAVERDWDRRLRSGK